MNIQQIEDQHVIPLYAKREIALVRGHGSWLFDSSGKKYLDLMSNYGPNILGHSHPVFVKALQEQAALLINCHQSFYNDRRAELIQAYTAVLPKELDCFFFSNSGTECVEAAIKFARVATGRKTIIATKMAYHGRTFGSLGATGSDKYKDPYRPMLEGFQHVPYGEIKDLHAAINQDVAAVILEPIQGEGGIRIPPPDYLPAVRKLCNQHQSLLILDEVQTGFRTGKLFAFEHFAIVPDILCVSKGIANGLPMGMTVVTREVSDKIPKGTHGNTFGGNPLAARAAEVVLDCFKKEHLAEHSAEMGAYFLQQLQSIDSKLIREVRGKGVMIGLELRDRVTKYLKLLQEHGVLALPAGATIIRFLPPLVITREEIDFGIEQLRKILI